MDLPIEDQWLSKKNTQNGFKPRIFGTKIIGNMRRKNHGFEAKPGILGTQNHI
jgi:hypothetical protein